MKYLKKFGNVTATNLPLEFAEEGTGWTAWTANEYFSVETNVDAFDGQALKFSYLASSAPYGCRWEPLGDAVGDCEVLARFKTDSLWSGKWKCIIALRCSDNGSTKDGYFVDIYNGCLHFGRYNSGSYSSLKTGSLSWTANEWVWMRARIVDDDSDDPVISAKLWAVDEPEPEDWMETYTDTSASLHASGWCGLIGNNAVYECDFLSFTDDPENESAPYELPDLIENFKAETVGEVPSNFTSCWTPTGFTFEAAADTDAIQQRVASYSDTGSAFYGHDSSQFSPNFTDGEVLVRFKVGSIGGYGPCVGLRSIGTGSSLTTYMCRLSGQNLELDRYDSGAKTQLVVQVGGSISTDTYYWMRTRIEDTHIYGKIWAASIDEPASWTIDDDDTAGTITSGSIVLGDYTSLASFDYISVGHGDDPAPMIIEQDFRHLTTFTDEFTDQWTTGTVFTHRTDIPNSIGGAVMNCDVNSSAIHLYTWDKIPAAVDDVELLMKAHIDNSDSQIMILWARCSGAIGGTADGMFTGFGNSNATGVRKIDNDTVSNISVINSFYSMSPLDLQEHWLRFRVNGTSFKMKYWHADAPEPVDWRVETTDSSFASGTLGHGFSFHSLLANEYIDYLSCGFNGDSPQLPGDEARPLSELGPGIEFLGQTPYTSNINWCRANSLKIPWRGTRIAGVGFRTFDEPFDANFRVAVYINKSETDLSDATLVEDLGSPVSGHPKHSNKLFFSNGPRSFAPGTVLWIVFKSNNNTVALKYSNELGDVSYTNGNYYDYTTDFGSDETVAFPSTTGTLTPVGSGSLFYGVGLIIDGGKYHSDFRRSYNFEELSLGVGDPADWTVDDYFNKLDCEIISGSGIGGNYLNIFHDYSAPVFLRLTPLSTAESIACKTNAGRGLVRMRVQTTRASFTLLTRPTDGGGSGYLYQIIPADNTVGVYWQNGSSETELETASKTFTTNTWYWLRAELIDGVMRVKAWAGGIYEEPVAWDVEHTLLQDYSVYRGPAALTLNDTNQSMDVDYLAVASQPAYPELVIDDFTGTDDDDVNTNRWTIAQASYAEITVYNNQCRVERTGMGGPTEIPHIELLETLIGDFTMVVDYDCQTVRQNAADNTGFFLRVEDSTGDEMLQIGAGYNTTSGWDSFNWIPKTGGTDGSWDSAQRTNTTGKMAIIRSGTTITLMYQDGTDSWATAETYIGKWTTVTTFKLRGRINTGYHATDAYTDIRLDNFRLYDFAELPIGGGGPAEASYKPAIIIVT